MILKKKEIMQLLKMKKAMAVLQTWEPQYSCNSQNGSLGIKIQNDIE